ncbi:hypothetical protein FB451DRAFT_1180700 [Mycena latifolia]|nr:hypothetical protein FB451DRAFT_1180700 [Mycena latifolia]
MLQNVDIFGRLLNIASSLGQMAMGDFPDGRGLGRGTLKAQRPFFMPGTLRRDVAGREDSGRSAPDADRPSHRSITSPLLPTFCAAAHLEFAQAARLACLPHLREITLAFPSGSLLNALPHWAAPAAFLQNNLTSITLYLRAIAHELHEKLLESALGLLAVHRRLQQDAVPPPVKRPRTPTPPASLPRARHAPPARFSHPQAPGTGAGAVGPSVAARNATPPSAQSQPQDAGAGDAGHAACGCARLERLGVVVPLHNLRRMGAAASAGNGLVRAARIFLLSSAHRSRILGGHVSRSSTPGKILVNELTGIMLPA